MRKKKYRIVTDAYAGFEVQVRHWLLPIWSQDGINSFATIDGAMCFIRDKKSNDDKKIRRLHNAGKVVYSE